MNWQEMLQQIRDSGLQVTEIAAKCDASRTAISDLLHGHNAEPKYHLALAIIALHKRVKRRR
jgi:hypothetical protein